MVDNLSPYYSAGTATLTNGSAAVTGQSSLWLSGQLRAGDRIESDAGEMATILTIDSDTAITLDKTFKGTSQTAAPYKIWRTTDAQFLMESARKAYSLLGAGGIQALAGLTGSANKFPMFSGPNTMTLLSRQDITNGVKFDARVDTLADRAAYDASAADFSVLVSDIGDGRAAIYTKNTATAGDWSDPAYITGAIAAVEVGDTTTGDYGSDAEVVPTPIAGGVSLAFTIPGSPAIEVGSTTTLAPGSAATVEPTPVAGGISLAFGIPAGKGFAFGGEYDNATAYVLGDVVRDNGSSWIALQATTGNTPPAYPVTSNPYWELLAVKGQDGTGIGDVVGPASAPIGNLAVFDGTTGKLLKDGGVAVSGLAKTVSGLPTDGVTDALAFLVAAQAASDVIRVPPGTYFLSDQIDILDGKEWILDNVEFVHGDDTKSLLSASAKSGWSITGKWKLTGLRSSSETGPECGLTIDDCTEYRVAGGHFSGFKGAGLRVSGTTIPTYFGGKGQFTDLLATGCANGYDLVAGSGAEYGTWSNCDAVANETGVQLAAGNHSWNGGTFTDNTIGVNLLGGTNHGHGVFNGTLINHNTTNIQADGLTLGHLFSGCSVYDGLVKITNSKNIVLAGCQLECTFECNGTTGFNYVRDCHFPDAETTTVAGIDPGKLQFVRNTGAISRDLNASSTHYAGMYRGSATQALTPGTTLIFPTALTNRNGDYDAATGEWTCPEDGRYRVIFNAVVNAATLGADNSYIDVQTDNGAGSFGSFILALPSAFGAAKLRFSETVDVGLNAGMKLRILTSIDGTSVTFGDSDWLSLFSIERIG